MHTRLRGGLKDVYLKSRRNTVTENHVVRHEEFLRNVASLTADLRTPNRYVYWIDLLLSSTIGYSSLAYICVAPVSSLKLSLFVVASLALYRSLCFMHEISHFPPSSVPGFRTCWNLLVGMPLLMPSFLYQGVHHHHHVRSRYGTRTDPDYVPFAARSGRSNLVFLAAAPLLPIALLMRHALLVPGSHLHPKLRSLLVTRGSALAINPEYRRLQPIGEWRRHWVFWETATCLYAMILVGTVLGGLVPVHVLLLYIGVLSAGAVVNQLRTVVSHLWESDGTEMTLVEQYLDSVTVPPPTLLPSLWAPVGLRYHALHHLIPSLPYHSLGKAHRRLSSDLVDRQLLHAADHPDVARLLGRVARLTGADRDMRR